MRMNARIYVMRAEDGTLKLGHSKDPDKRSRQLGRAVEVVHTTDVIEHAERIERLAHRVLALHGRHIRGEWFEADLDDAILAIDIAIRQAEGNELKLAGELIKPEKRPPRERVRLMTGPEAVCIIDGLGVSQVKFAHLVGLSANAITKWAKGQPPSPVAATLLRLLADRPELVSVLEEREGRHGIRRS